MVSVACNRASRARSSGDSPPFAAGSVSVRAGWACLQRRSARGVPFV